MPEKMLLTSSKTLWDKDNQKPYDGVVDAFQELKKADLADVAVLSNNSKPDWFDEYFDEIASFHQVSGRQSGSFIKDLIRTNPGTDHDTFITLGASNEDFYMSCNTKTLLIRADWAKEIGDRIKPYGVGIKKSKNLSKAVSLLKSKQSWYFQAEASEQFEVYALANGGDYYQPEEQKKFANELRQFLKEGEAKYHRAFLLHFFSSLAKGNVFRDEIDWWGFYPSSDSSEDDTQIMGLVTRKARTMISKARTAPVGKPLLIRHINSDKRSAGQGNPDRTDPTDQIQTMRVNPHYKKSIKGKKIAILDDFTTYGASLSCAAALLLEAGAEKVVGIAMGKFGKQSRHIEIDLSGVDVFKPIVQPVKYQVHDLAGTHSSEAQFEYLQKFAEVFK